MSDYYYYDGGYQNPSADLGIGLGVIGIITMVCLAVLIIMLISYWKLFVKAGKPGWTILIPFYSNYKMYEVTFGAGYGYLAFIPFALIIVNLIPIVGQIISLIVYFWYIFIVPVMFVKRYGASTAFGIGTIFLPVIFFPILAFSDVYQYMGPIGYAPFGIPALGGNKGYVGGNTGYNGQTGYYGQNGQAGYYGQNPSGYQNGYNPNGAQAPNNWNGSYSQGYQGQPQNNGRQVNLNKDEFGGYNQRPQNDGSQFRPQGNMGQNPMSQRPYQNPMGQNPMGQRPYQNPMGQRPYQNPQGNMGQRPQGYGPNGQGQGPQNYNGYNQGN